MHLGTFTHCLTINKNVRPAALGKVWLFHKMLLCAIISIFHLIILQSNLRLERRGVPERPYKHCLCDLMLTHHLAWITKKLTKVSTSDLGVAVYCTTGGGRCLERNVNRP